ncbi:MAG: hypothetical protein K0B81_04005 [Candidatus Cloacimonetes bacterium]|nr:hypothetical protein [Candidatus Cloacimonadota bacterium]
MKSCNDLFYEVHPYPSFIPNNAKRLIIGSFPPIKLTRKIKDDNSDPINTLYNDYLIRNPKTARDLYFYYGSDENLFWKIIADIYKIEPLNLNTIQEWLTDTNTAVTDIIDICVRKVYDKVNKCYVLPASIPKYRNWQELRVCSGDIALYSTQYRNIPALLVTHKNINHLIFTGNFVFRGFMRAFKDQVYYDKDRSEIVTDRSKFLRVSILISPSGAANKSIGSTSEYKIKKEKDPHYNTYQYRLEMYRDILK